MNAASGPRPWSITLVAAVIGIAGAVLTGGGGWLAALGGSAYYLLAGLALIAVAVLLGRQRATALVVYAVPLLGTAMWSVWEVGMHVWLLMPRLLVPMVVGLPSRPTNAPPISPPACAM
jgi:quinoprotein glucose dehydrogenase